MSFVETFGPSLIEAAARELGLHYYSDDRGNLLALFLGESIDSSLHVHLRAEGDERDIYVVRTCAGRYFEPDEWPRLLGLINRWHAERRWPRVGLVHLPEGTRAAVECEAQLRLQTGVHQALVTAFTEDAKSPLSLRPAARSATNLTMMIRGINANGGSRDWSRQNNPSRDPSPSRAATPV